MHLFNVPSLSTNHKRVAVVKFGNAIYVEGFRLGVKSLLYSMSQFVIFFEVVTTKVRFGNKKSHWEQYLPNRENGSPHKAAVAQLYIVVQQQNSRPPLLDFLMQSIHNRCVIGTIDGLAMWQEICQQHTQKTVSIPAEAMVLGR